MDFPFFTEDEQPTMANFNKKLKQAVEMSLSQGLKLSAGSYTGTGATTKTINFSFNPRLVLIVERLGNGTYSTPLVYPNTYGSVFYGSGLAGRLSLSWRTNSLIFTATDDYAGSGIGTLNTSYGDFRGNYYYIAIG